MRRHHDRDLPDTGKFGQLSFCIRLNRLHGTRLGRINFQHEPDVGTIQRQGTYHSGRHDIGTTRNLDRFQNGQNVLA